MTETRFKLREEIDFFDNGKWITYGEVVDLLNKLNDENKQLSRDCSALVLANQDLRHENEELRVLTNVLKIQNKKFKGRLTDLGVEYFD